MPYSQKLTEAERQRVAGIIRANPRAFDHEIAAMAGCSHCQARGVRRQASIAGRLGLPKDETKRHMAAEAIQANPHATEREIARLLAGQVGRTTIRDVCKSLGRQSPHVVAENELRQIIADSLAEDPAASIDNLAARAGCDRTTAGRIKRKLGHKSLGRRWPDKTYQTAHANASRIRQALIARLDSGFDEKHPLRHLLEACRGGLASSGHTPATFMQSVISALFPEEFLPRGLLIERMLRQRNRKGGHDDDAGILPNRLPRLGKKASLRLRLAMVELVPDATPPRIFAKDREPSPAVSDCDGPAA